MLWHRSENILSYLSDRFIHVVVHSITWYVYSMYLGNKGGFFFSTWKYFALFPLVLLCCCARYVVIFILYRTYSNTSFFS